MVNLLLLGASHAPFPLPILMFELHTHHSKESVLPPKQNAALWTIIYKFDY